MMILKFSEIFRSQRPIQNPVGLSIRKLHKKAIEVTWEKPGRGWIKLNFDGSFKPRTGNGSIGGIFRNHKAEFLLGYAEPIGITTSTVAEIAALHRGLELVLENGWRKLWLEGDAKTLIETIVQRRPVGTEDIQKHVREINLILPELKKYRVTHIYREGNRAAHKLAQMGHHLEKPQIWRHAPDQVLSIVREDAEGRTFLRKRDANCT